MCRRVYCGKCGKYSWEGCGKHVTAVYQKIEEGNHCMCRSWPGVIIRSTEQQTQTQPSIPPQGNGIPRILEAAPDGGLK